MAPIPPRTNRARLVPLPVLTGHVSSPPVLTGHTISGLASEVCRMAPMTRRAGAPVEPRAARRAHHFRPSHTRGRDAFQLYTSDVDF